MRKTDKQNAILAAAIAALSAALVKQIKSTAKKKLQLYLRDRSINMVDPEDEEDSAEENASVDKISEEQISEVENSAETDAEKQEAQ